jgi:hypothetical protein
LKFIHLKAKQFETGIAFNEHIRKAGRINWIYQPGKLYHEHILAAIVRKKASQMKI